MVRATATSRASWASDDFCLSLSTASELPALRSASSFPDAPAAIHWYLGTTAPGSPTGIPRPCAISLACTSCVPPIESKDPSRFSGSPPLCGLFDTTLKLGARTILAQARVRSVWATSNESFMGHLQRRCLPIPAPGRAGGRIPALSKYLFKAPEHAPRQPCSRRSASDSQPGVRRRIIRDGDQADEQMPGDGFVLC